MVWGCNLHALYEKPHSVSLEKLEKLDLAIATALCHSWKTNCRISSLCFATSIHRAKVII